MIHTFTLQAAGLDTTRPNYEDALYEAGCDDALVVVRDNTLFLDFARESPSFDAAVRSAELNVAAAGGKVVRVLPTPER